MIATVDKAAVERVAAELDPRVFDGRGRLRVVPAEVYRSVDPLLRMGWAAIRGLYCLPTRELCEALEEMLRALGIRPDDALEVGAGHGAIARELGIRATDSFVQRDDFQVRRHYERLGQALPPYGDDVEKLEASEAVVRYQPRLVLGCWVTHRWQEGDEQGFIFGVDEDAIVDERHYLCVGHDRVHVHKRVRRRGHVVHRVAGLVSRDLDDRGDAVWLFYPGAKLGGEVEEVVRR